jgi:hypothetical protein
VRGTQALEVALGDAPPVELRVRRRGVERVRPAIASSTSRVSSSVRAIGPDLVERPRQRHRAVAADAAVGRAQPVTPQKFDGQRIEPQVSVPIPNGTSPAPIAAPVPDDEPPAQRSRFHGLRIGPCSEALPRW